MQTMVVKNKKAIFACLVALSAAPAIAEWTEVGKTQSLTSYIDFETIRKDGDRRKVWELWDYPKQGKEGELSSVLRMEIDCKEEKARVLTVIDYSKNMAQGIALNSTSGISRWRDTPPATLGETVSNVVCNWP